MELVRTCPPTAIRRSSPARYRCLEDTGTPKFRGRPRCTLPTTLGEDLRRIGRQLRNFDDIDALRTLDRRTWRDLGREPA